MFKGNIVYFYYFVFFYCVDPDQMQGSVESALDPLHRSFLDVGNSDY